MMKGAPFQRDFSGKARANGDAAPGDRLGIEKSFGGGCLKGVVYRIDEEHRCGVDEELRTDMVQQDVEGNPKIAGGRDGEVNVAHGADAFQLFSDLALRPLPVGDVAHDLDAGDDLSLGVAQGGSGDLHVEFLFSPCQPLLFRLRLPCDERALEGTTIIFHATVRFLTRLPHMMSVAPDMYVVLVDDPEIPVLDRHPLADRPDDRLPLLLLLCQLVFRPFHFSHVPYVENDPVVVKREGMDVEPSPVGSGDGFAGADPFFQRSAGGAGMAPLHEEIATELPLQWRISGEPFHDCRISLDHPPFAVKDQYSVPNAVEDLREKLLPLP